MAPTRTARLVVLLLCPVALLNHLDRQIDDQHLPGAADPVARSSTQPILAPEQV